jgi:hypothetical protein
LGSLKRKRQRRRRRAEEKKASTDYTDYRITQIMKREEEETEEETNEETAEEALNGKPLPTRT